MEGEPAHRYRLSATRREGERVMPLELFFDLVFVLALTQCTALMANDPTWSGLGQGVLVLTVLWWSWTGYAWLTSVLDPEEGAVRIAIFAAMAAFLIVSICVPDAFGNLALLNRAPHPNAAKVFINWGLSREGQTAWVQIVERNSRRLDVPNDPHFTPKAGTTYVTIDHEDTVRYRDDAAALAREILK